MEPQADLEPLPQAEVSKMVVTRAKRTVPYPILGENTLVRSRATQCAFVCRDDLLHFQLPCQRHACSGPVHTMRAARSPTAEHHQHTSRPANPCPTHLWSCSLCAWPCEQASCAQVLSDSMVLTEDDGGLCLMVRVGDTFPNQILDPIVRAYLYRWPGSAHNPGPDYTVWTHTPLLILAYGCCMPGWGPLA